ncbi:hypothetical protein D3C75_1119280 [compost metagenome]
MAQVHFNRARLGKLADIGSGHKTGVTAGKYNRPHLPIASQCPKVLGELFTHRAIERVLGFWPVDAYDGNAVFSNFQVHYRFRFVTHTHL